MRDLTVLKAMSTDSVIALSPDLKSCIALGFVRMPIQATGELAVKADEAAAKRLSSQYRLFEEGPIQVGNLEGYKMVTEFIQEKKHRKRLRAYFHKKSFLYFFVCDAVPPERYDLLKKDFEQVIKTLQVTESEEGKTLEQDIISEFGKGTISGRVYTNKEYNCFIAAPEGWEIATSPNPSHLVEMKYKKGHTLVRLIAAKGLGDSDDIHEIFKKRLEQAQKLLQDFKEISRRDTTIQGHIAVESVQTYSVENLGRFHVKEINLVKDGSFFMILCQAIEPDLYENLEKDFDEIIQSFGFIQ